ncbi:MAG: septum formation initiator family protein, partial [Candidatus Thiodiazotropha sp. (ex Lucinoma kastoroae)]|nr:septum formation initiator family protein [Candidatus Thiodiazotropha sp. (ex Lucinoma kastoroae)]
MRFIIALLIGLLLFLQYRLWVGEGSLAEVNNLKHEISQLQQEMIGLRERNRALQAEVEDLRTGQTAIEERARSELGMIKEGYIYIY